MSSIPVLKILFCAGDEGACTSENSGRGWELRRIRRIQKAVSGARQKGSGMKSAKAYWDKAAPRYARSPIKDEQTYQKKLSLTRAYLRPDWSVLEFGCGSGGTAIQHAPYVKHVLATDVSSRMIEIASERIRDAGVDNIALREGTLQDLGMEPGSFDAVLGLNILHLVEDVRAEVACVHRLLRTDGVFVSSTALVGDLGRHWRWLISLMQRLGLAPHVNAVSKQQLVSILLDAGFDIDLEWQPGKESVFVVAIKRQDEQRCSGPYGE